MNNTFYYLIICVLTSCSNQIVLRENIVDMGKEGSPKIYYQNKLFSGIVKEYYSNGNLKIESLFKRGKLNGNTRMFSEKGVLILDADYKNNYKNGIFKQYNDSGILLIDGFYKNDKKHLVNKQYDDSEHLLMNFIKTEINIC